MQKFHETVEELQRVIDNLIGFVPNISIDFHRHIGNNVENMTPERADKFARELAEVYELPMEVSLLDVSGQDVLTFQVKNYSDGVDVSFFIDIENGTVEVENNEWHYKD